MVNLAMREDARAIWDAAGPAADPVQCVHATLASTESLSRAIIVARRIVVVGGGKAGAAMAAALEGELDDRLDDICGIVNVPAGILPDLKRVQLHIARPAGTNEP